MADTGNACLDDQLEAIMERLNDALDDAEEDEQCVELREQFLHVF